MRPHVSIPLPLFGGEWMSFQAAFPMTEENWTHMMKVLDVMKAGLVAATPEPSDTGATGHQDDPQPAPSTQEKE